MALSWELYRVLNGLDPNIQQVKDETYLTIEDETIDVDDPKEIEELNNKLKEGGNNESRI
jgi:hypothetical protein